MIALTFAVLLILGGCASALSGSERAALHEAQRFITKASTVYRLPPIEVIALPGGASFRRGLITLDPEILRADPTFRAFVVSHETAHYVLGHDRDLARPLLGPDRQRLELDANAKAVEILESVSGWSHAQAVATIYIGLAALVLHQQAGGRAPWGHPPACEELAEFVRRFAATLDTLSAQRGIPMSDCRTPWIAVPGSLR